ncbi:(ZYRO0C13002g) [Zygosaccharomyces parabailii]|uniref:ZYBA0S03-04258g1_1 n=1 Tax=Zygosaccharomyces bailii (strain CLIB 213 / ATCC 58445 / CBS 680 / BCRC 21525 / NBRC 1098 / NCYC 1416 / NRRL Y-2227) TaxID=1333698 RepID=A0A8J2T5F2_ZYGB2|nr:(ZYRO0C13002g) [Zygosaccharomyces parabailii]CDF88889.1 ZYBA0S03-04258g1_1 [Zygosaccharomyces bailii CLIB 213]CDH15975.1 uncharacterized protein ZBAI_07763 [Zygosaccharomyces bailii ISA1307]SJM82957.1 uncharacterized protein ZBIST_0754 [Zygosaccharomyces bailii]
MPVETVESQEHGLLEVSMDSFERLLYHHELQMQHLVEFYHESKLHRTQLEQSLMRLSDCICAGHTVVVIGCGKSHLIAAKVVSTMRSMAMSAFLLHPTEAMHGDMGMVRLGDCLLICSSGGETDEILQFLRYASGPRAPEPVRQAFKIAACGTSDSTVSLMCDSLVLLPQRYTETDVQSGLKAPTLSTTSMLVVLDCMCLSLSEMYYKDLRRRAQSFEANHPGGGIGRSSRSSQGSIAPVTAEKPAYRVGHLKKPVDELQFLQTLVMHDWVTWKSNLVPSRYLQKLYSEWKAGQLLETFEQFLERLNV